MFENPQSLKGRLKAAGIHLGISLLLAGLAALLVFLLWYPYPYREISGGRELFFLVVTVDVVMGPLLTLTIFNTSKPRKELKRDLAVIGILQLAALTYGLWTVSVARPVHLVFEIDRFRVVHAIDVPREMLKLAPGDLQRLPLTGPTMLSMRDFKDQKENTDATMAALGGADLGARPDFWQPYELGKPKILAATKPLADLKKRFPARLADIDKAMRNAAPHTEAVGYIPVAGRQTFWTAFVDMNTSKVIAFAPIDPF